MACEAAGVVAAAASSKLSAAVPASASIPCSPAERIRATASSMLAPLENASLTSLAASADIPKTPAIKPVSASLIRLYISLSIGPPVAVATAGASPKAPPVIALEDLSSPCPSPYP